MKKFLAILFTLFLIIVLVAPATVWAENNSVRQALAKGADRMLSYQGAYGGITGAWPWQVGTTGFYWNVQGISAAGLIAAYEGTKNQQYLDGAIATGDTLLGRYEALVADGVQYGDRPYSSYVEFLAWLARESKNQVYAEAAVKWYTIIPAFETAEALSNRYITVRKSLSGWDLASQIRAALAVGQKDYAKAIADEVVKRQADWVNIPYGGWDYTAESYGSMLWALDQVGAKQEVIDEFRKALLNLQAADGSWDEGGYQATAYAILGLSANKGKDVKKALDSAASFLVSNQSANGGWVYVVGAKAYEYAEEDSEVLMSLAALLKGGNITNVKKAKLPARQGKGKPKIEHMQ